MNITITRNYCCMPPFRGFMPIGFGMRPMFPMFGFPHCNANFTAGAALGTAVGLTAGCLLNRLF